MVSETYQAASNDNQDHAIANMEQRCQKHAPLDAVVWTVHNRSEEGILPDYSGLCYPTQSNCQQANHQPNHYSCDTFHNCVRLQPAQRRLSKSSEPFSPGCQVGQANIGDVSNASDATETMSSLRFGIRAKGIMTSVQVRTATCELTLK